MLANLIFWDRHLGLESDGVQDEASVVESTYLVCLIIQAIFSVVH